MSAPPVTFFLPGEGDLAAIAALDPDRDPAPFQRGDRAWILQTFARLRDAGMAVELSDAVPRSGLVLFHAKHDREIRRALPRGGASVLVGVRADNRQALSAEFEVVQNGRFADGVTRHFVPFWPQPALAPRDPARGTRVERVAFKGYAANLHPDFLEERWRRFLAARGIEWSFDADRFRGAAHDAIDLGWASYREVDVVLAVRPPERKTDYSKPASKLVNAWLAGTPALLGPEYAFRELRRSPLDYLEVDGVATAERAIDRLCAEPSLFSAMVENGRERGREFESRALVERWRRLLTETLPELAADPGRARRRRWPIALRRAGRWLARAASGRPPR